VGLALEGPLHVGEVDASGEEQGYVSVPHIVPAYVRHPRPPEQGLVVPVDDVLRVERVPLPEVKTSLESS